MGRNRKSALYTHMYKMSEFSGKHGRQGNKTNGTGYADRECLGDAGSNFKRGCLVRPHQEADM